MDINGVPVDNNPIVRRVIQVTCDVAGGPVAGLRILDLACAHGAYALEAHFATAPAQSYQWRGKRYWGTTVHEHAANATPVEKLKALGASLDNEASVWLTPASLCNVLRHVGFTSVSDCRNPVANLYVGRERQFRIWGNRATLVAIKGQPVNLHMCPETTAEREVDWPEDLEPYLFEREVQTLGKAKT